MGVMDLYQNFNMLRLRVDIPDGITPRLQALKDHLRHLQSH